MRNARQAGVTALFLIHIFSTQLLSLPLLARAADSQPSRLVLMRREVTNIDMETLAAASHAATAASIAARQAGEHPDGSAEHAAEVTNIDMEALAAASHAATVASTAARHVGEHPDSSAEHAAEVVARPVAGPPPTSSVEAGRSGAATTAVPGYPSLPAAVEDVEDPIDSLADELAVEASLAVLDTLGLHSGQQQQQPVPSPAPSSAAAGLSEESELDMDDESFSDDEAVHTMLSLLDGQEEGSEELPDKEDGSALDVDSLLAEDEEDTDSFDLVASVNQAADRFFEGEQHRFMEWFSFSQEDWLEHMKAELNATLNTTAAEGMESSFEEDEVEDDSGSNSSAEGDGDDGDDLPDTAFLEQLHELEFPGMPDSFFIGGRWVKTEALIDASRHHHEAWNPSGKQEWGFPKIKIPKIKVPKIPGNNAFGNVKNGIMNKVGNAKNGITSKALAGAPGQPRAGASGNAGAGASGKRKDIAPTVWKKKDKEYENNIKALKATATKFDPVKQVFATMKPTFKCIAQKKDFKYGLNNIFKLYEKRTGVGPDVKFNGMVKDVYTKYAKGEMAKTDAVFMKFITKHIKYIKAFYKAGPKSFTVDDITKGPWREKMLDAAWKVYQEVAKSGGFSAAACMNEKVLKNNYVHLKAKVLKTSTAMLSGVRTFFNVVLKKVVMWISMRAVRFLSSFDQAKPLKEHLEGDISTMCLTSLSGLRSLVEKYVALYKQKAATHQSYKEVQKLAKIRYVPNLKWLKKPPKNWKGRIARARAARQSVLRIMSIIGKGFADLLRVIQRKLAEHVIIPIMAKMQDLLVTSMSALQFLVGGLLGTFPHIGGFAAMIINEMLNAATAFIGDRFVSIGTNLVDLVFNKMRSLPNLIGGYAVKATKPIRLGTLARRERDLKVLQKLEKLKALNKIFGGLGSVLNQLKPVAVVFLSLARRIVPTVMTRLQQCDSVKLTQAYLLKLQHPRGLFGRRGRQRGYLYWRRRCLSCHKRYGRLRWLRYRRCFSRRLGPCKRYRRLEKQRLRERRKRRLFQMMHGPRRRRQHVDASFGTRGAREREVRQTAESAAEGGSPSWKTPKWKWPKFKRKWTGKRKSKKPKKPTKKEIAAASPALKETQTMLKNLLNTTEKMVKDERLLGRETLKAAYDTEMAKVSAKEATKMIHAQATMRKIAQGLMAKDPKESKTHKEKGQSKVQDTFYYEQVSRDQAQITKAEKAVAADTQQVEKLTKSVYGKTNGMAKTVDNFRLALRTTKTTTSQPPIACKWIKGLYECKRRSDCVYRFMTRPRKCEDDPDYKKNCIDLGESKCKKQHAKGGRCSYKSGTCDPKGCTSDKNWRGGMPGVNTRRRRRRFAVDPIRTVSCSDYVRHGWCTKTGGKGKSWKATWKSFEYYADHRARSASDACCGCGGGKIEVTAR